MHNNAASQPASKKPSWKTFERFAKAPKGHVLGALILLTLVGSRFRTGHLGLTHAVVAAAAALVFDAVVAKALGRKGLFSTGGLITGLIVGDVLSSLVSIPIVVLTTWIALASKHLLKRGRKPLFNPAAVGLLISALVFASAQSWWAGMPLVPVWALAVMLAAGIFVAVRVKKYPQVLAFLGTYFILLIGMAQFHLGIASATPADALREPFVNAALFFGFFMLTDPPTTPATTGWQIIFSVVVAFVSVAVFAAMGGLIYLLIGLMAGNLLTAAVARSRAPVKAKSPSTPVMARSS